MGIIGTIIIGLVVGLLARALMPGRDTMGLIMTTLLGIGGAFIGKYIGVNLGLYRPEDSAGFFMSLFGAVILLILYNFIKNRNVKT